jgi:hypothetical protein
LSDFLEYLQAEGSKHLPSEPVDLLPFFEMIGWMFLTKLEATLAGEG